MTDCQYRVERLIVNAGQYAEFVAAGFDPAILYVPPKLEPLARAEADGLKAWLAWNDRRRG